jgi:hypothetical protein
MDHPLPALETEIKKVLLGCHHGEKYIFLLFPIRLKIDVKKTLVAFRDCL